MPSTSSPTSARPMWAERGQTTASGAPFRATHGPHGQADTGLSRPREELAAAGQGPRPPPACAVPKLTITALLAVLLAAHGLSRWDPEPHPLGTWRSAAGPSRVHPAAHSDRRRPYRIAVAT